jgi:hypothetical protein
MISHAVEEAEAILAHLHELEAAARRRWERPPESETTPVAVTRPTVPITDRPRRKRLRGTFLDHYMGDGDHDLRGCGVDGDRWMPRFARAGWEIQVLRNLQSTKAAARAAREWTSEGVEPGDWIGLVDSSHGTLLPGPNGTQMEGICFADCLADDRPETFVNGCETSVEIAAWLHTIPAGVRVFILLDCCHSQWTQAELEGIATRSAMGFSNYRKPRFLPSPWHAELVEQVRAGKRFGERPREIVEVHGLEPTLVTMCETQQTSADARIDGVYCGAGSAYTMATFDAHPELGIGDLIDRTEDALRANGFDQVPVASGSPEHLAERAPWAA